MSNEPDVTIRNNNIALINGKTYSLLQMYDDYRVGGIFFLAVAGRVPLRYDDLAKYWKVIRQGDVYLAMSARPFSYHLIEGDGTPTDAPNWPGLRTSGDYFAFVGPTEEAVKTQVRLTLERYHSRLDPADALDAARIVRDKCGGPPAYILKAEDL
jgi:hypothetical protein